MPSIHRIKYTLQRRLPLTSPAYRRAWNACQDLAFGANVDDWSRSQAQALLPAFYERGEPIHDNRTESEKKRDASGAACRKRARGSIEAEMLRGLPLYGVSDRTRVKFDVALEMIEAGELICQQHETVVITKGPVPRAGRKPVRTVFVRPGRGVPATAPWPSSACKIEETI